MSFRPGVEALEARDVPATNIWYGTVSTDFSTAANWSLNAVPVAGDDIIFGTPPSSGGGPSAYPIGIDYIDCDNMGGATGGAYGSVTLLATYTGRVTLAGDFETSDFTLAGGTIDQPSLGTGPLDTEITVTGDFTWTGGTLNSTTNLSNLILDGATALFAPDDGGTVSLGSNLCIENGAVATLGEGTVNISTQGVDINVGSLSRLVVDPGIPKVASLNVNLNWQEITQINIATNAWLEVRSGTFDSKLPLKNSGGSLVLEPNTTTSFKGKVDKVATGPAFLQTAGATYIAVTASLSMLGDGAILMTGGLLSIKCGSQPPAYNGYNIIGDLKLAGANIEFDPAGGARYEFGEFRVTGAVTWTAGTYHHFVAADSFAGDSWSITGTLSIGGSAAVAAKAIDSDDLVVVPPTGRNWNLFDTDNGGVTSAAGTPSLTVGWNWVKHNNNPCEWWKVKYVG